MRDAVRGAELDPPSDVHGPAEYRRQLAEVGRGARARGRPRRELDGARHEHAGSRSTSTASAYEREVEARRLLVHLLRDDLGLTGTHIGCDTGNCGACTVILDGAAVKSCMLLAVQADGGIDRDRRVARAATASSTRSSRPSPTHHALQCGYCTPGMLMSAKHLLDHNPEPTETRDPAARSRETSAAARAT